jgi:hypothetical protein
MGNLYIAIICTLFSCKVFAQNATVSGGGQISGTGGSVSYSIGQVVYSSLSGTTGSIIQGVQQPFEISIITTVTDIVIDLKAQVYPNPAANQLLLNIATDQYKNIRFVLTDVLGRALKSEHVMTQTSYIDLSKLNSGTYLLRILSKNKHLKTFQIIKNK